MADTASTTFAVSDRFLTIPVGGGRRLSARLWLPTEAGRYPVILDFSPYRAWDLFRGLGEITFPFWAAAGYAVLQVDIAGSGASTGVLVDEYLPQEIDDVVAAIEWCTSQEWSDGNAGLTGFSWSAFTALRASDRRPPQLKAMVLGGVSEDGWLTDIHYLGGIAYGGQVDWAGVMLMFNALPPDPAQFGTDWRTEWKTRLNANRPWLETWLAHPEHDDYWREKAAKLTGDVPLLLFGGLADKYATSLFRIAEAWQGEVRAILGPWEHALPHIASRVPRVGWLQEALRWWDHWLKGRDTGVLAEKRLRLWVGAPDAQGETDDGCWRALDWPPANARALNLVLRNRDLIEAGVGESDRWFRLLSAPPLPVTLDADLYEDVPAPFALRAFEDAGALVAQSQPRVEDLDIVGTPTLRCTARASIAGGEIVARLLDLAPDGTAIRMTTAAWKLDDPPTASEIVLTFKACAWRLSSGHSIALVICGDGAPALWPVSRDASVEVKDINLSLPVMPATNTDQTTFPPPAFPQAATASQLKWLDPAKETIAFPKLANALSRNATSAAHHWEGTATDYVVASRFELASNGAGQARAVKCSHVAFERPGFSVRVDTRLELASTQRSWQISWTIRAREGGRLVHDHSDSVAIPRVS